MNFESMELFTFSVRTTAHARTTARARTTASVRTGRDLSLRKYGTT